MIRVGNKVTRAEIADLTGLTRPTITYIVRDLISDGVVVETGTPPGASGRDGNGLDINPDAAYSIGLHMGRDVLTGVLIDLKGTVHDTVMREPALPKPGEDVAPLIDIFQRFKAHPKVSRDRLLGVGLATAGPLNIMTGRVTGGPQMSAWEGVPLAQLLTAAVKKPVFFDNSGTAATIGEKWFGIGSEYRDFLLVCIGQGLGGGLVLNGRIHRGRGLNAGELGHIVVDPEGHMCPCGTRGCLETRFSLAALQRDLGAEYSSKEFLKAQIDTRSPKLLTWLDEAAVYLAQVLGGIDNLLDLDAIVLGGHIGRFPREILQRIRNQLELRIGSFRMRGRPEYARIEISGVQDSAEALGAATLPINHAFFPDPSLSFIVRGQGKESQALDKGVFT
jgi:predicted NBD/HSP70 family sugar kinase